MKITFRVADDYAVEINSKEDQDASTSSLRPPVVIQNKAQTFYYPTSEVEQAGYYHHQQSHHQQAQAPWLAASTASGLTSNTKLVNPLMHFLVAISVLQWVITL